MKTFRTRLRRLARRHRRLVAALLAGTAVWVGLSVLRPLPPPTAPVLVALHPLMGGQSITAGDVAVRQLPVAALPTEFLQDPGQVVGRPLTVSLPAGAILLPTSVVTKHSLAAPGLAAVPVALTATAAGLVEVGDRIDLLAADSEGTASALATSVRVLAVLNTDRGSSPLAPTQSAGPIVLIELSPAAVPRVAAAAAQGPLGFGLR